MLLPIFSPIRMGMFPDAGLVELVAGAPPTLAALAFSCAVRPRGAGVPARESCDFGWRSACSAAISLQDAFTGWLKAIPHE
ncbi:MAG TPA: hypothetical protein VGN39_19260 [Terriglobales bacterium]|jgi:hypothetical protein|nr:hypothetical protein [Terriglobales bacterium]